MKKLRISLPQSIRALSVTVALVALVGCASSNTIPDAEYALVRGAINEAQEVQANAHAGGALLIAERKLQRAKAADSQGDGEGARALLEEAEAHAVFAEAVAMKAQAQANLNELNATLRTLERELERN